MDKQRCDRKDKRLLVLLAFGAGVLSTVWFTPKPGIQSCYYILPSSEYLKLPVVVRSARKVYRAPEHDIVQLSDDTACPDIPPQLAVFFDLPLPLNRADEKALSMLPGIGPRLSENIVNFRREQGKISGPGVLLRIDGIGKKMTERLSTIVCFD